MRVVAIILIAALYQGCAKTEAQSGAYSLCYDGVLYAQFPEGGVSVKYNQDGSVATCN